MGSGLSRLNVFDYGMTCGPFQPLRHKIHEIRKMDIPKLDGTPSTKMLLRNAVIDEDSSNDGKSNYSLTQKESGTSDQETKKIMDFCPEKKRLETEEEEEGLERKNNASGGDDNQEEGGRFSDFEGSFFMMRSPSFRDFCVDSCDSDDSVKNGDMDDEEKRENKTQAKDAVISRTNKACNEHVEQQGPKRGSQTPVMTKGRRERGFRKVFSHKLGHSGGMKKLLNVKGCYHPHSRK